MSKTLVCPRCKNVAVTQVGTGANGEQIWKCSSCGLERVWCPECDQGWVKRMLIHPLEKTVFHCDECSAVWPQRDQIGLPGVVNFWTYLEQNHIAEKDVTVEQAARYRFGSTQRTGSY